jgi:hypothetical protein
MGEWIVEFSTNVEKISAQSSYDANWRKQKRASPMTHFIYFFLNLSKQQNQRKYVSLQ